MEARTYLLTFTHPGNSPPYDGMEADLRRTLRKYGFVHTFTAHSSSGGHRFEAKLCSAKSRVELMQALPSLTGMRVTIQEQEDTCHDCRPDTKVA